MLDLDAETPDDSHLTAIRERVIEIIETGATPERKALCEAPLAELSIDDNLTATPVIRVPPSWADTPSLLKEEARTANGNSRLSTSSGPEVTAYEPLHHRSDLRFLAPTGP